jgi:ferredoxin
MRLIVDPIRCDAYGYCAELAPELIHLDSWGYPVITSQVPENHEKLAREIVAVCPRRALQLRE